MSFDTNTQSPPTEGPPSPPAWDNPSEINKAKPAPLSSMFNRTDSGNANWFACCFGNDVQFDHRRKRWLFWRDGRWQEDVTEKMFQFALEAARRRLSGAAELEDAEKRNAEAKWALKSENLRELKSTLELAKTRPRIANDGTGWDSNPSLLGVDNGVLDLSTGEFRSGQRDDKITKWAPVSFDPDATCPTFDAFLKRVQPEAEMQEYLQRQCGYALTGLTSEQSLLFHYGLGSNGKTTFVNAIRGVLGQHYAMNAAPGLLLRKHFDSHPTELAELEGARLVLSSEVDGDARFNEALIKQLTGQERVKGRRLYRDFVEFEPTQKYWLIANTRPAILGGDFGIWRRLKLVPWSVCIREDEKDMELDVKLRQELAGILNWMLRGLRNWQENGMNEPASVREAIEEYRADSDVLADFLEDRCVQDSDASLHSRDAWQAYQRWAQEQGITEREMLTNTAFGLRLRERFLKKGKRYYGVGVRPIAVRGAQLLSCLDVAKLN